MIIIFKYNKIKTGLFYLLFFLVLSFISKPFNAQKDTVSEFQKKSFIYEALNLISFELPSLIKSDHNKLLSKFTNDSVFVPNDFLLENKLNEVVTIKEYIDKYKYYFSAYGPKFRFYVKEIESVGYEDSIYTGNFIVYKIRPKFDGAIKNNSEYSFRNQSCKNLKFPEDSLVQKITITGSIRNTTCLNKDCLHIFPNKVSRCTQCYSKDNLFDFWNINIEGITNVDSVNNYIKLNVKTSNNVIERGDVFLNINNTQILIEKEINDFSYAFNDPSQLNIKSTFPQKKSFTFSNDELNQPPVFEKQCHPSKYIALKIPNNYYSIGFDYHYNSASYNFGQNMFNSTLSFISLPTFSFYFKNNILIRRPFELYYSIGLGSTNFNFESSISGHQDVYSSIDYDGYSYERKVNFINHTENVLNRYLSIPIALGVDIDLSGSKYSFMNNLELDFNVSYAYHLNYSSKSIRSATVKYSGFYQDLFGLIIQENGVYDFGTYDLNFESSMVEINNSSLAYQVGALKKISNDIKVGFFAGQSFFLNNILDSRDINYISNTDSELNSVFASFEDLKAQFNFIKVKIIYKL